MGDSSKLFKFFKDKVVGLLKQKDSDVLKDEGSSNWSCNNESVMVKKKDIEALQEDVFNQTEIIKKLKVENKQNVSIIQDYEDVFEKVSFIEFDSAKKVEVASSYKKLEDEIERLKSSESRLKSHIKALKRDLLVNEQSKEAELGVKNQIIANQLKEIEEKDFLIKKQNSIIQELSITNTNMKFQIEKRSCESLELIEICRELLKDFV